MVADSSDKPATMVQCACGKRYRLRAVRPGQRVQCRHCGDTISVPNTPSHRSLDGPDWLTLAEGQVVERPAPPPEFAMEPPPVNTVAPRAPVPVPDAPATELRATFLWDLLTSFSLAGSKSNAINLLMTAIGCAVPALLSQIPLLGCLAFPVVLILSIFVLLFVVHFFWSTLTRTAGGEDDIPVIQTDWTFWEDAIKPALWLIAITAICLGPAYYLNARLADDPHRRVIVVATMLTGSLFWPVAVMSVALGETLLFLRPDWLVRCILGIGPVYLVAWLQILLTLGVGYLFSRAKLPFDQPGLSLLAPIVGYAVELYLGYVIFRTLGLLFRHYRTRFPWKF